MRIVAVGLLCIAAFGGASVAWAQQSVTRAQAIDAAITHGPRLSLAAADTSAARALLMGARAYQNPLLSMSYSKSVPQYHVTAELPLDFPWLRRARIASAAAVQDAAHDRFALERAAVAFDAETTYTNALVANAHAQLSRHNAQDADSLLHMARARRDAGDASELDVQLATVYAGQQENQAMSDSMAAVSGLLDLQTVMGQPADALTIALADTLALMGDGTPLGHGAPLSITAATSALRAADRAVLAEQRSAFGSVAIQFGFENRDPSGVETGILPLVGISIPLPVLNKNQSGVAAAEAERDRARAELQSIRLESARDIAKTTRARDGLVAKVTRDRTLLESANRVATMSLTAYREGAVALPNVLEAQRNAREALAQYIDDLGAANDAVAALRLLTASASQIP